jgi:rod shape-determining protein MreD
LFSLTTNEYMGGFIGLFTGLVYDILIMDVIGINTLIYFIIGVSLGHFSEEINKENKPLFVLITVIASVFYHFTTVLIMFFLRMNVNNIFIILDKIIIQIVLNSLLCVPVLLLVDFLLKLVNIKLFNNKL